MAVLTEMTPQLVYFVTGANRGIGRGLVEALLLRSGTVVIVAVRDPSTLDTGTFSSLSRAYHSEFIVVKIDARSDTDAQAAIRILRDNHEISKLDVVIANSGVASSMKTALETSAEDMRDCYEVNAIGALRLFQAVWPLLETAANPRFFVISSSMGSLRQMEPLPGLAYSCSKAAANLMVLKLHYEHEKLVSSAFHPGFVRTGMGYLAAKEWRLGRDPWLTVQQCVDGILPQIEAATKLKTSGKLLAYDGQEVEW